VLEPQLKRLEQKQTLPFASSLCGACYEVCPVKIDIPSLLIHLRGKVNAKRGRSVESMGMAAVGRTFASRSRYERAQRMARGGLRPIRSKNVPMIPGGPLGAWLRHRELPKVADETFREWWRSRP
jgi:L-lactate dehydrogenase complex protein LldF